jgi:PAS domain S-box-containing protein
MEPTLSANPERERDAVDALRSDASGAAGHVGHRLTVRQSSFAAQSQKVSEEEFRQILDLTPLFVTVLGPRRERLYINRMGLDFLGTTHTRWRDTRPSAELHPDDLEPVQFHWNSAFSNALPFECEFRSRRSDGVYRWLLGRCNTVRDEEGQVRRWHAAFTDIEDRKRAEERLLQEKAAFRAETGLDNTRLQRVLDYIAANFSSDITLENLAEIAGYSTFHFARKFTLAVGISPHRYIGRMRLENAMAELEAGKSSLAEIAFNAHFSSQASFTRAFHRATGTTPNEYRRRRR